MTVVVDASAILAVAFGEPGGPYALVRLSGAFMSAVNLAEAMSRAIDRTGKPENVMQLVGEYGLSVEPFTAADADAVAVMRAATRSHGLSLGDRACLAVAQRLGLPALTADRAWAEIDVGVAVELIR